MQKQNPFWQIIRGHLRSEQTKSVFMLAMITVFFPLVETVLAALWGTATGAAASGLLGALVVIGISHLVLSFFAIASQSHSTPISVLASATELHENFVHLQREQKRREITYRLVREVIQRLNQQTCSLEYEPDENAWCKAGFQLSLTPVLQPVITQLDIALGVTSNDFTLEVYFIPDIVPLREGREEVCDCGLCQHYFYGTAITKDAAKQLDCKCSPAVRGFESRRPFQQHITNNTHLYYDGDEPKPMVYFRRFAVCPIMEPCGVEQIGVILLTSMQEEEFVEDVLDTLEFLAATVSNFQKEYNRCFCKNYE